MQLSLPTTVLPDTTAAATVAAGSAPGLPASGATPPARVSSFEDLLPATTAPAVKPAPASAGAEQAAVLSAALWMPVPVALPATPVLPPSPVAPETDTSGEGTNSADTGGKHEVLAFSVRDGSAQTTPLPAFSSATSARAIPPATVAGAKGKKPAVAVNTSPAKAGPAAVRPSDSTAPVSAAAPVISPANIATVDPTAIAAGLSAQPAISGNDATVSSLVSTPVPPVPDKIDGYPGQSAAPAAAVAPAAPAVVPVLPAAPSPEQTFTAVPSADSRTAAGETAAPVASEMAQAVAGLPVAFTGRRAMSLDSRSVPSVKASSVSRPVNAAAPAVPFDGTAPSQVVWASAPVVSSPGRAPGSDAPAPDVEKIAARPSDSSGPADGNNDADKKEFLTAGDKSVTTASSSVGIGVAQVSANMSSAPSNRPKTVAAALSAPIVSVTAQPVTAASSATPVPVATVRETMAAVVSAVDALERGAGAGSRSVDLQFSVGTEKLGLHVELRDGVLHTTFRTDSPELRGALTAEWHAVVPESVGRQVTVAQPVFSAASTGGSSPDALPATANNAGFGSLGGDARQSRNQPTPEPAAFSFASEFSDAVASESAPAAGPVVRPVSLLNVFA